MACRHFFSEKSFTGCNKQKSSYKIIGEWTALVSSIKRFLIGRPLKSTELGEQKLNKTKALAILSSDALSSVAYGPEQILIALAGVGAIAYWYSIPIAVVLVLLTALILSYRQIIFAYPHGGSVCCIKRKFRDESRQLLEDLY